MQKEKKKTKAAHKGTGKILASAKPAVSASQVGEKEKRDSAKKGKKAN